MISSKKLIFINLAAFISIAILLACSATAATQKDSEGWSVTSAWVRVLPEEEQTPVLMLLYSSLRTKIDKEIVPKAKSGKDMMWAVKVDGAGNFLLSELSTNSPSLERTFQKRSQYLLDFIRGKTNANTVKEKSKESEEELSVVFSKLDKKLANEVMNKYSSRIKQTQTALQVAAMILAGG